MKLAGDKNYHSSLWNCVSQEITGSVFNCFLAGSCGRKVRIPVFLLCSAWPEFARIVKDFSCCDLESVSLVFPEVTVETLELVQELVLFGTIENPDHDVVKEFRELLVSLKLGWETSVTAKECFESDDENSMSQDCGVSVTKHVEVQNKVTKDSCVIDDPNQTHEFQNTVTSITFENVSTFLVSSGRKSEFCSKSCTNKCNT